MKCDSMKEFIMDYDQFTSIRRDRLVFYTEDPIGFKLYMPINSILLTTTKMKKDLLESNIPIKTFREHHLARAFPVENPPKEEPIISEEKMIDKFVGWQFGGSRMWIVNFFKDYDFPLITDITKKQRKQIKNIFVEGLLNGHTLAVIQKKLLNLLDDDKIKVERIIRTELNRGSNESALERYKVNGVKKVKWLATLDIRTSDICRENNGKEFTLEEAKGKLPAHVNCRSVWIPIVE